MKFAAGGAATTGLLLLVVVGGGGGAALETTTGLLVSTGFFGTEDLEAKELPLLLLLGVLSLGNGLLLLLKDKACCLYPKPPW